MFIVTAGHGILSGIPRSYSTLLQTTGGCYGFLGALSLAADSLEGNTVLYFAKCYC